MGINQVPVTVRYQGKIYDLSDTIRFLKRGNLYKAREAIDKKLFVGDDNATALAIAIRDSWQAGHPSVNLRCDYFREGYSMPRFCISIDTDAKKIQEEDKMERMQKAQEQRRINEAQREKLKKQKEYEALSEEEKLLKRLRRVNDIIPDDDISNKLYDIEDLAIKIIERVKQKPELKKSIQSFYSEYFPKAVLIGEKYCQIYKSGIRNSDVDALTNKLSDSLDTCIKAFNSLYERTFDIEMLELSAEMAAFDNKINFDGLAGDDFIIE